ncbi:MAG: accessory Sec system protein Asp1, partial [Candidatus Limosilactobacillus intestinavium]
MNYFAPAWHSQQIDWALSSPTIEFDDAVSHLRILQDNNYPVGIILTDFQPQITTKLNQLALFPNRFLSAFDYLQGIQTLDSQVVDFRDLSWPSDAYFDFTNFRIFVMEGHERYARIVFDVQGKILQVDYDKGPEAGSTLLFDSRGFISRQSKKNLDTYFDQSGNWRFKHNRQTDQVTVNRKLVNVNHDQYTHLSELLTEVVKKHFLPRLESNDRLIVTVDDDSKVDLTTTFDSPSTIYSVSRWHPYQKALLSFPDDSHLIVDTKETNVHVQQLIPQFRSLAVLPLFQSQ